MTMNLNEDCLLLHPNQQFFSAIQVHSILSQAGESTPLNVIKLSTNFKFPDLKFNLSFSHFHSLPIAIAWWNLCRFQRMEIMIDIWRISSGIREILKTFRVQNKFNSTSTTFMFSSNSYVKKILNLSLIFLIAAARVLAENSIPLKILQ